MNLFAFLSKEKNKKVFACPAVFSQVYIYPDGRVFLCPDCYMSSKALIGNLNEYPFEKIWNSKKAIEVRKEVKKGIYNYCKPSYCFAKSNYNCRLIPFKNIDYSPKQKKFPKMVCIGSDCECNVNCIMCRPTLSRLTDEELVEMNKKIDSIFIPILKDAEELTLSTTADPFASRHTSLLMKTAVEKYPNLKLNLLTNGILCSKTKCDELGVTSRLSKIMVSFHASNEETYNNVVKNGNFKKVIQNIEWLSELKGNNKIDALFFAFVVSSKNYQDIPNFVEFTKKYNAKALFWCCRDWGGNLKNSDEPLEILQYSHPKHQEFVNILKQVDMNSDKCYFSPELKFIAK